VIGAFLTVLLAAANDARADFTVYSNFSPGQSYNTTSGWLVGNDFGGDNIAVGDTFTASQTGTLSQITVALEYFSSGPNAATVSLRSDAGGTPGGVLESWSLTNLPTDDGNFHTPTTVTDSTNAALTAGASYWVVVSTSASSAMSWQWNNTGGGGVTGNHATSYDGGATWFASADTQGAFSVTENVPTNVVPGPSTLSLLIVGLGALAGPRLLRRRRR
jgi:hypothetical protein